MTLTEVREHIDLVDSQIKKLFQERMGLADQVAQVKAETGDDIFKPDRENVIIEKLTKDVRPEIKKEYTALIKRIMAVSRKYQYGRTLELRDCMDITWSEEEPKAERAVMRKQELYICNIVSKDTVVTVDTFEEVAVQIEQGQADAGIGILEDVGENVSDSLHELLVDHKFYINHCDVVTDSGVRRKVVLFTKNLVVRPEHNRLKLMFKCANKSGSLAGVLSMISDYDVNLTEIHSRPDHRKDWNYEIFIELEANLARKEIQALLFQLMSETEYCQILGSYLCDGDF